MRRAVVLLSSLGAVLLAPYAAAPGHGMSVSPGEVIAAVRAMPEAGFAAEDLPLLEVFTATWCPPCAPADRALDRLLEAGADFHLLTYHPWPDTGFRGGDEDPFGFPEGAKRMTAKHDAFWFPSAYADGVLSHTPTTRSTDVAAGAGGAYEAAYTGLVAARADAPAHASIRAEAEFGEAGEPVLRVRGNATLASALDADLRVVAVVAQDPVRFQGGNGADVHRMVARTLEEAPWPAGASEATFSFDFPVAATWDRSNLSAVVFVEAEWRLPEPGPTAGTLFAWSLGAGAASAAGFLLLRRRRPAKPLRTLPTAALLALALLVATPLIPTASAEGVVGARLEGDALVVDGDALPPEVRRVTVEPAFARRGEAVHVTVEAASATWERADVLFCRVEPAYNCGQPFRLTTADGLRYEGAIAWEPRFFTAATRTVGVNVSLSRGAGDDAVQVLAPLRSVGLGVDELPPEVEAHYVFYRLTSESVESPLLTPLPLLAAGAAIASLGRAGRARPDPPPGRFPPSAR